MRNNFYKILVSAALLATLSCNKELNTVPTQSIDQAAALNTSSDVLVALTGCYADLGGSRFYGGYPFVASELLANNGELNWSGTFQQFTQMNNKAIPVDNSFVYDTWSTGYIVINDVNNVLSALAVVDSSKRDQVEGEAKFIRASAYFDLVRLYAKSYNDGDPAANDGVPIVLTPTRAITAASKVKRNKVSEVYAQVLSDLTAAETKIPAKNSFYATKVSASGMLARVYLQMGDYANAAAAANRAITTGLANGLALKTAFADAFPSASTTASANTTEDIFAMQVTPSSGANSFQTFFSSTGRGDIQIKPAHTALYEAGDARLAFFYTSGGSLFTGKNSYLYSNVHILRLAEMYLTRAEANFRAGAAVGDTPLNDINVIRLRAKLTPLTAPQLDLAAILKERHLELAFEGHAIHDIKRTQGSVGAIPWNSPKLIYPIPSLDRTANSNLSQNDGY